MTSIAYAAGEGGGGIFGAGSPLLMMGLIFVVFYFLLIRPQQKKAKDHRQMIANLKKGDRIVTGGGIHGRITGLDETVLTVEIADKVRVKVTRGNVSALTGGSTSTPPAKADTTKSK